MNLAIDIGNSFTHVAVFSANCCICQYSFQNQPIGDYSANLSRVFTKISETITAAGISCVVPKLQKKCVEITRRKFNLVPLTINYKTLLPIKLKILNPRTIGADRLCNAVAGYEYFRRRRNVIIADFGTANTYDIVLKNGDFLGGIIAPGIMTSARALNLNTGKLPLMRLQSLKFGRSIIGRNTEQAIRSGLLNYPLHASNGLISSIERDLGRKFKVILTGGSAKLFHKRLNHPSVLIENTVLEGINIILKNMSSK